MTKSTDLVYAGASLRERQDYAIALSKAGELIPRGLRDPNGQPNAGKILLVTEYGNALGIHPIVAINGIDIIEGRLTITPALMSGLIRDAGHKLRVSTDGSGQQLTATAVLVRADDPQHPFEVTWTMDDAKAAGLEGKTNWKKYPRAMLKARAISEVAREGAEDVLMGTGYNADEMGAVTNESGEVIEDAEIVEQDHDGLNVRETMRNAIPNGKPRGDTLFGHPTETEVTSRPVGNNTRSGAQRPGRPRTDPVAGTAEQDDPRTHSEVAQEWIGRIADISTLDGKSGLYAAHDEAARLHVLDFARGGKTVEAWFVDRRQELQDAAQQAAAGEPDEPLYDESELV